MSSPRERQEEDEILADVLRRILADPSSMVSTVGIPSLGVPGETVKTVSIDGFAVVTALELEVVRRVAGRN